MSDVLNRISNSLTEVAKIVATGGAMAEPLPTPAIKQSKPTPPAVNRSNDIIKWLNIAPYNQNAVRERFNELPPEEQAAFHKGLTPADPTKPIPPEQQAAAIEKARQAAIEAGKTARHAPGQEAKTNETVNHIKGETPPPPMSTKDIHRDIVKFIGADRERAAALKATITDAEKIPGQVSTDFHNDLVAFHDSLARDYQANGYKPLKDKELAKAIANAREAINQSHKEPVTATGTRPSKPQTKKPSKPDPAVHHARGPHHPANGPHGQGDDLSVGLNRQELRRVEGNAQTVAAQQARATGRPATARVDATTNVYSNGQQTVTEYGAIHGPAPDAAGVIRRTTAPYRTQLPSGVLQTAATVAPTPLGTKPQTRTKPTQVSSAVPTRFPTPGSGIGGL